MSSKTLYTVNVSGEVFHLNETQLWRSDYLSSAFQGDFIEAQTRSINVDRSPELFAIICDWLAGYDILPLGPNAAIPKNWSLETANKNLLKDAIFYGLDELVEALTPKPKAVEKEEPPSRKLLLLPPLDFSRGAWSGSTPNLAGPCPLGVPIPEPLAFGQHGIVLQSTASREQPTAVVFSATDVHVSLAIDAGQGTIRARWTFLHPEEASALQDQLPAGRNLDFNTGCAAGSITRQVLMEAGSRQFNFDAILLWAASKIPGGLAATAGIAEDNNALDTLFCVSTPLAAPEEGIRVAMICKRLLFAVFCGAEGYYLAPLFCSAQPLSHFWSTC